MFRALFSKKVTPEACRCAHGGGRKGKRCFAHPLCDFAQGVVVSVISNHDHKTLEMGLYTGATVRVIENRPGDANMIVAAGEGRFIISKATAAHIKVR